jgi:hypothetical protein
MIVDQLHISRRPIFEPKNDAPIRTDSHRPKALQPALKRMQPQGWEIEIFNRLCRIEIRENNGNALD